MAALENPPVFRLAVQIIMLGNYSPAMLFSSPMLALAGGATSVDPSAVSAAQPMSIDHLPSFPLLAPSMILILCVLAGIGTVMLLPGKRESALGKLGGVLLLLAGLIAFALLVHIAAGWLTTLYFWIFAAISIGGAIRVVTHPRPVYSALYFVLTIFASAGLFILLQAEFMAAALVLIYAGAILVTYVFVIMLASQSSSGSDKASAVAVLAEYDTVSREPLAACAIGFALMGVLLFVIFDKAQGTITPAGPSMVAGEPVVAVSGSTQELGMYLFRHQLVQLELAGLILTMAMVGAIVIARRRVMNRGEVEWQAPEVLSTPATPIDDNPHSIPVYGTTNPRQKAFPQT